MIKIAAADDWNLDAPPFQVKLASAGLRGHDYKDFVKRAGHEFLDKINSTKLAPDEVMVHLPLVGATEFYSNNRNGDGFRKKACQNYHHTFVKLGRLYRDHANEDPYNSYGRIIASTYREPLGRLELLVGYNGSPKTATVNGGHVADRELQKLASGTMNSSSMACRVAYDVCSGCGNKARHRGEYCTPDMCKYGGLRDHIGQIASDGHSLHADNPHPYFFDCSDVPKPAERIANALGIVKQAGILRRPAELSPKQLEYWGHQDHGRFIQAFDQQELAMLEETVKTANYAELPASSFCLPPAGFSAAEAVSALAYQGIALPPREFLWLVTGNEKMASVGATHLRPYLPQLFRTAPASESPAAFAPAPYLPLTTWAAKMAADYSLITPYVVKRAARSALHGNVSRHINNTLLKTADACTSQLLDEYRHYQRGFLATVQQQFPQDFSATRLFMLCRNKLS